MSKKKKKTCISLELPMYEFRTGHLILRTDVYSYLCCMYQLNIRFMIIMSCFCFYFFHLSNGIHFTVPSYISISDGYVDQQSRTYIGKCLNSACSDYPFCCILGTAIADNEKVDCKLDPALTGN